MGYEQLIVDTEEGIATIRLNNPARLNALSATMTMELLDVLERMGQDRSVRATLITGEGRGFSSGADLSALQEPYLKGERPSSRSS